MLSRLTVATILAVLAPVPTASAQTNFTAGNLTVYTVGSSGVNLSNTGNAVTLQEFTTSGSLSGFMVTLPSTGTGPKLVASGTAASEGMMTLGNNGQTLALTGYNATIPTTGLVSTTSATVSRTVALVGGSANAAATTGVGYTLLSDYATGNNPRSAYTTNGTDIYAVGGAGGIRYTTAGSTTSTQLSTTTTNLRDVNVFGGQLYVSSSSGTTRIATVGSGTPTTTGQTITNLPGAPASSTSPYQFFLARVGSPTFSGPNVLYVADDSTNTISKYTYNGTTWATAGTVAATGVRGLTGVVTGDDQVTLYGTTGSSSATVAASGTIYGFTDTAVLAGSVSGTAMTLNTSATTAYRGIAFSPATLVHNDAAVSTWDLTTTNFTNTAPATPVPNQAFVNAYAGNFGNIAQDNAVVVGTGINPAAVNVTNSSNTYTFTNGVGSNGIQGLAALNKGGSGTLVLASPNTYSGGTTISGGILYANNATGSATGIGAIAVSAGGTLAGSGTVTGAVTVASGGFVQGGTGGSTALTNTLNTGAITLAGGATLRTVVGDTVSGNTAADPRASLINLGTSTLSGTSGGTYTIRLTSDGTLDFNQSYTVTIATFAGSSTLANTDFAVVGDNFSVTSYTLAVNPTNITLQFVPTAVPEPTTILGFGVAGLGLMRWVRRRRK